MDAAGIQLNQAAFPVAAGGLSDNASRSPRRSQLNRYRHDSSARRKLKGGRHCVVCGLRLDGSHLYDHLRTEKRCSRQYMSMVQVSSFCDLVKILFSCEMCKLTGRIDFKKHLERHVRCLLDYRRKYGVEDIGMIAKIVQNEQRKTYTSRSSSVRKKRREEEMKTKSVVSSLNEFRENCSFGNYRHCVACKSNFREYGARPIKKTEDVFESLGLRNPDKMCLRRFETFYLCNYCEKKIAEPNNSEEVEHSNRSKFLGEFVDGDSVVFYPLKENGTRDNTKVTELEVKIMFPTCMEAISEDAEYKNTKPVSTELRKLYGAFGIDRSQILTFYLNELEKYKRVKEKGDMYTASIQNLASRKVENVEKITSCLNITGSNDWFQNCANRLQNRQEQFGFLHLTIEMKLLPTSLDVIATCLLQEEIPVTLDKESLPTGEFRNIYYVHPDHKTNQNCTRDCSKVEIKEYIGTHDFDLANLNNKFVGTYVSSCYQKMYSFSRYILEAPSSTMFSENYQLFLMFDGSGAGSIIGCVWPKALDDINAGIATCNGTIDKADILKVAERNICCTGQVGRLMSDLKVSEEEAETLSELVLNHQLNLRDNEDNRSLTGMPSLETILVESCSSSNLEASKKVLNLIEEKIVGLSFDEKRTLNTGKFLQDVWEECTGEVSDEFDIFEVEIPHGYDSHIIRLRVDERLTEYLRKYDSCPFNACYHYALSCCGNLDKSVIVLKRLWIVDCYIAPFNPFWLKAICPSTVHIVKSTERFQSLFLGGKKIEASCGNDFDPKLKFSHRLVSLQEALSLADPAIKKVTNSSKDQFINASPSRKVILKKVHNNNEENFTILGSNDQFELLPDVISRHFNRKNTEDKILLAETGIWYDFIGADKSVEVAKMFKDTEIPVSEDEAVCSSENLPNFILCKNGDVLKKRRRKKILVLPNYRSEYNTMYAKCLLFLPIISENELIAGDLRNLYEKLNEEGVNIVIENEKKLFQMKVSKQLLMEDSNEEERSVPDYLQEACDAEDNPDEEQRSALDYLIEALDEAEDEPDEELCIER